MKRWGAIALVLLVLLALAALLTTVLNKRWWLRRAVQRWGMRREMLDDGSAWLSHQQAPFGSYRESWLLEQPLRRLREFYDTGDVKGPALTMEEVTAEL